MDSRYARGSAAPIQPTTYTQNKLAATIPGRIRKTLLNKKLIQPTGNEPRPPLKVRSQLIVIRNPLITKKPSTAITPGLV